MANSATNDEDYIRQYGDNPSAPDLTPVNAADRAAPYNATQDFLNAAAIGGTPTGAVSPGVGQPGSTDATDQTNLNVAAAMERADLGGRIAPPQATIPNVAATAMDQYATERQAINQQRAQIMARLGIIPPQQAGMSAVVLANPRERVQLIQNLDALENHSARLLQEHHYSAIENARQAHEDLARNTHIQVSTGIAKMMGIISQANQQYGVGSKEAKNAILGAYSGNDPDIAAARGTKTFEDRIKPYTDLHDVSAARLQSAVDAYRTATGREPSAIETTATGGINIRTGQDKAETVPSKTLQDYSGLQADRAEQQSYLDQETDPKLKAPLQKKISVINAQIQSYERQFPQLAPKQIAGTAAATPSASTQPSAEVTRTTQDGRSAVFDANTKKFLRYGR